MTVLTLSTIPATTATTAALPEVVGKAVYLEATPVVDAEGNTVWYGGKDSVKQIIIFPGGKDTSGRDVAPTIYERVLSKSYPKAQWRNSTISALPNKSEFVEKGEDTYRGRTVEFATEEEVKTMPDEIKKTFLANGVERELFSELMYQKSKFDPETSSYQVEAVHAWTVTRKFAVEITDKDLTDVRSWKTPQAVVRRINKVRVSLGLPEKLI